MFLTLELIFEWVPANYMKYHNIKQKAAITETLITWPYWFSLLAGCVCDVTALSQIIGRGFGISCYESSRGFGMFCGKMLILTTSIHEIWYFLGRKKLVFRFRDLLSMCCHLQLIFRNLWIWYLLETSSTYVDVRPAGKPRPFMGCHDKNFSYMNESFYDS